MMHVMLSQKIGLGILILSVCGGCAREIPPAAEKKAEQVINSESARPTQVAPRAAETKQSSSGPTEQAPGMIIHIDPRTGEFLSKPPVSLPADKSTAGTAKEPRVVPSPVPGGGVMIELDDRFKTPLKATVGPDGEVTIQHQDEKAISSEKKK